MTTIKHSSSHFVQPQEPLQLRWSGYDDIPDDIRSSLVTKTLQIRSSLITEANALWDRGRLLDDVSKMLTPEQFVNWAYVEFNISRSNAYETMNVYQCFPDGLGPFASIAATAIRELARPATPPKSYDRVRALLEAGKQPSIEDVKTIIQDARSEEKGYRSFENEDDGHETLMPGDESYYAPRRADDDYFQFPVEDEQPDDTTVNESNDEYLEQLEEELTDLRRKYDTLLRVVRRAIERRSSEFETVELTDHDLEQIANLL